MVKQLHKDAEFGPALKEAGSKLVVVDFFATWCGPCKRIAPQVDELAKQNTDVVFLKVDVDEMEQTMTEQDVSAMPTFIFYKNGSKVDELVGADFEGLKKKVAQHK